LYACACAHVTLSFSARHSLFLQDTLFSPRFTNTATLFFFFDIF
jgi:hypothetical protein